MKAIFSDLDSSNEKSIINSKMYGNCIKSGTYFSKLRKQLIDKFISGKPLKILFSLFKKCTYL